MWTIDRPRNLCATQRGGHVPVPTGFNQMEVDPDLVVSDINVTQIEQVEKKYENISGRADRKRIRYPSVSFSQEYLKTKASPEERSHMSDNVEENEEVAEIGKKAVNNCK